jgi:hypothetical protein
VLDPFGVAKRLNDALEIVRRGEQARLTENAARKQAKGWRCRRSACAAGCLRAWISLVSRLKIESMKKVARMLRRHEDLLLKNFRAKRQ